MTRDPITGPDRVLKLCKNYSQEIPKIIGARKGSWNVEKMLKLVEEV